MMGLNRFFDKEPFAGSKACKNIPLSFCTFANPTSTVTGKKVDKFLEDRRVTSVECFERNSAICEAASYAGLDQQTYVRGVFLDSEMSVTMFHLLAWAEAANQDVEERLKLELHPVSNTASWDTLKDESVLIEPHSDLMEAVSIDKPVDISFMDICGTFTKHCKEIVSSFKQLRKNARNVNMKSEE